MNIKPIPDELLGENITLITPSAGGGYRKRIYNVRVEKLAAITDYSTQKVRDNTVITVWYDYSNSYPSAEFPVGARVEYDGETFEIIEQKIYSAGAPHHCKFKARKISDTEVY